MNPESKEAQRFVLAAVGRAWTLLGSRKKLEARKMLEKAAESHTSGARFVGRLLGHVLIVLRPTFPSC